jgi:hypothetical protein
MSNVRSHQHASEPSKTHGGAVSASCAKSEANLKCPICSSRETVLGRVLGGEDRSSNRFHPDGLRLLTFARSIPLAEGAAIRACLKCGLLWSYVEAEALSSLVEGSGSEELRARLAAASTVDANSKGV